MKILFGNYISPDPSEFSIPITLSQIKALIHNKYYMFEECIHHEKFLTVSCIIYLNRAYMYRLWFIMNESEYNTLIVSIPKTVLGGTWLTWTTILEFG